MERVIQPVRPDELTQVIQQEDGLYGWSFQAQTEMRVWAGEAGRIPLKVVSPHETFCHWKGVLRCTMRCVSVKNDTDVSVDRTASVWSPAQTHGPGQNQRRVKDGGRPTWSPGFRRGFTKHKALRWQRGAQSREEDLSPHLGRKRSRNCCESPSSIVTARGPQQRLRGGQGFGEYCCSSWSCQSTKRNTLCL